MSWEFLNKALFKAFFVLCHTLELYSILAWFSTRFVQPIGKEKTQANCTILVTDYERFRGDVDIFSQHSELSVSYQLLQLFYCIS